MVTPGPRWTSIAKYFQRSRRGCTGGRPLAATDLAKGDRHMRNALYAVLGAALLVFSPMAASAQERAVHVNLGGGPTFNLGDLGEHFGMGWGPAVGVTFDMPGNQIGFQFEY